MTDNISYEDLPPPPFYLLHDDIPQPPPRTTSLIEQSAKVKLQAVVKFQKIAANKKNQREFINKFKEKYDESHSFPPPPQPLSHDVSKVPNQVMAQSHIVLARNISTTSNPTFPTTKPTPVKQSNSKQTSSLNNNSYYSWRDEECKPNCPLDCNSRMQAGIPRM